MAKPGEIPRQKMPEQEPQERVRNYREVPLGFDDELAKLEASRCLQCKKPTCRQGCPVDVNIPEFIKLVTEGKFLEAAWSIKETNALPAVCGRVCPQESQCENVCVLGKKFEPVAVGRLERFVADYERVKGDVAIPVKAPSTGKRVAVVGAGPAGLTVAGDLIKLGHEVHIFEALHKPGGVLVYGIPEFRLPKAIVEAEVSFLESLGVRVECDAVIGKIQTVRELLDSGFHTVFLGVGAGLPMFMNIPNENLIGIYSANEYLTRVNLMKAYLFPDYGTPVIRGRRVAVIGGGNVAMDSCRTALRLGAEKVFCVYRRSREEMPARAEEIHHGAEEGIDFQLLTNPVKYLGDEKGRLMGLECLRMELGEPDDSGRRRPIPVKGSEFVLEVDTAVVAIGNGANPLIGATTPDLETRKGGYIVADEETGATSINGVYSGGDIVTGAATVISAMGAGKRAARAMHQYMMTLN
jgi:glutamate synthase (NADPH/NADH) small chain